MKLSGYETNTMEEETKKIDSNCDCGDNCNCDPSCNCGCHCGCKKKVKIALLFLAIIVLGAIVIVSILRDRIVNQNQFQISVVGQGRIAYEPDTANITLGVQIDKVAKAEDALNQLNDKTNKIIEAVTKLGVAREDIKTQNYNLYANYDYVSGISKISGYNANESIVIKVKDIQNNNSLISKVISEATKAGANQINGVVFDNSNIDNLKQEARVRAILNAKEKSKEIEKSLGVKLGKIVGMWENYISPVSETVYSDYAKGGMGAGVNVTPNIPTGTYEVFVETNLSYKIK